MPSFSVSLMPVTIGYNGRRCVGLLDVKHETRVDGQPSDESVVSQLVIGYGFDDPDGLVESINEAVQRYAIACANNMSESEKEKQIEELKEKDDASISVSYSRQCNICYTPNPETRAVLTACGHFLCMSCVLTMEKTGRLVCPFCRTNTAYVKVHEDISEETEEVHEDNSEKTEEVQERVFELEMNTPLVDDIPKSSPSPSLNDHPSTTEVGEILNSRSIVASFTSNIRRVVPRFRSIRRSPSPQAIYAPFHSQNFRAHTVRVTNLPLGTTASDLSSLFNQYEQFSFVRFAVSPFGDNLHACCDFEDEQSARNICTAFNNFVYRDRILNLRMVD